MQVIDKLTAFKERFSQSVVTIGKYDGMHLGHQCILASVREKAQAMSLPSVVILSEPQPEEFFAGDDAPSRLTPFADKVRFLTEFGIDVVYRMTFDLRLSRMSADEFIDDVLAAGLGTRVLIVGDDFRFGRQRSGDIALLTSRGRQLGFAVETIEPCLVGGERVSSTRVRRQLEAGDCEAVRQLLGRYYSLSGEVIRGRRLGRQLGVPTANLATGLTRLPLLGVFAVKASLEGRVLPGVASLGYNPTVGARKEPSLEVHLFDFDEDIYGRNMTVAFLHKLRDEVHFPDLESLRRRMFEDIEEARRILAAHGAAQARG